MEVAVTEERRERRLARVQVCIYIYIYIFLAGNLPHVCTL